MVKESLQFLRLPRSQTLKPELDMFAADPGPNGLRGSSPGCWRSMLRVLDEALARAVDTETSSCECSPVVPVLSGECRRAAKESLEEL